MSARQIKTQDEWEKLVSPIKEKTFLQSWEWGQVQAVDEERVQYFVVNDNAFALVITINAKRGRYYLIPHGPIAASEDNVRQAIAPLLDHLKMQAREDKVAAIRVAPLLERNEKNAKAFHDAGFKDAPTHVHAEETWVLDISVDEDQILAGMRKTTRHAIRKAEKSGVECDIISGPQNANQIIERFWPLYSGTAKRHEFIVWPKNTIKNQLEMFGKQDRIFAVFAKHPSTSSGQASKDIAAAICMQYGDSAYYYHGASEKFSSKVSAAQLVQWQAILEAKRRGASKYNFWGIAPSVAPQKAGAMDGKPDKHHPFFGITIFKKGFGGEEIDYMHAQDYVLSPRYLTMWLADTYRRVTRGF